MLDVFYFIISQFYNFILILDTIILFGNISFLKLLILIGLLRIAFLFLKGGTKK